MGLAVGVLALGTAAQDMLPYQDASLPIEERVEDLLGRMSIEEKIGQMTQVEKDSLQPNDVYTYKLGSVLSGGGGSPANNTPQGWLEMVTEFDEAARDTDLGIPLIYGVDAVHGHNNLRGAVIFPHNINLGATRDPELVERIGEITRDEMVASGVCWNFAPVLAVVDDIRWGRTYESYGQDTALVSEMGVAFLTGLQKAGDTVATAKHYIGDGGTTFASSTTADYLLDQGDTQVTEEELRAVYLPPYEAAVNAGARTVMASFSSWNGTKMHAQKYLLTDVLKGELGFTGFIVSDWKAIDQINPSSYHESIVTAINAGIDMSMVPYDGPTFIKIMQTAVAAGEIPMERIDDAVRRILRVKFEMGLFEAPCGDESLIAQVGSKEHRAVARQAVSESLVLLTNTGDVFPLPRDPKRIYIVGDGADNIGAQAGGWTITWQGQSGSITPGTTLLQAVQATTSPETEVIYDRLGRFVNDTDEQGNPLRAEVGIIVIGEQPYAEGVGDAVDLVLPDPLINLVGRVRERVDKLVVVIYAGRPVILNGLIPLADAIVMAGLPGTEGAGITDVLFGDVPFTGKLSFVWPRSMNQIPLSAISDEAQGCDAPLFPFGYGLAGDESSGDVLGDC